MALATTETLFALDCGATNWRLFRSIYKRSDEGVRLIGEPQTSPLTSFIERKLPAVLYLNPACDAIESFGELARIQLENEKNRERTRDYFKPCIGSQFISNPLPHQKRYSHSEAMQYTSFLLTSVLEQIKGEKWRGAEFDKNVTFSFSYPVHWEEENDGVALKCFREMVLSRLPEKVKNNARFVSEPRGAMLSLLHYGFLDSVKDSKVTLIVDVGGSTTDIFAGQLHPESGQLDRVGGYGSPLGGGLYDAELAKYIAEEVGITTADYFDDPSLMVSLRYYSQRLKESLSRQLLHLTTPDATVRQTVTLVSHDGKVFHKTVTLNEDVFNIINKDLNSRFIATISRATNKIGVNDTDIHQVVLVGGGSQLFSIVSHLRERFGDDKVVLSDNPDEMVVQGTSLEYGIKQIIQKQKEKTRPEKPGKTEIVEQTTWCLSDMEGNRFYLKNGNNSLGRGEKNSIQIKDLSISRNHADLVIEQDICSLIDLFSTNGTLLNGEKINPDKKHIVLEEDELTFGDRVYIISVTNEKEKNV